MYLVLAYHRIGNPNSNEPGSDPMFSIPEQQFIEQMDAITCLGIPVLSQSELLRRLQLGIPAKGPTLVLGFDDGNASDLEIAAPILADRFPAIFYLTVSHLGSRLPESAVRDLWKAGFEVGCHGWTHRYLTKLGQTELWFETKVAKYRLEDLGGEAVEHFAYPGGRWNAGTTNALLEAGFKSAVNTAPRPISMPQSAFSIPRIAVRNSFDLDTFRRIVLQEKGLLTRLVRRAQRLGFLRRLTGDSGLDWIRNQIYA